MLKMLIADDEQWILEGLRCQLDWRALGIEIVAEAANGKETCERCEIYRPDIVLIDIRMPLMDGLRFAEYAQEHFRECAVIVMSGYADFEYARSAMKYGVASFLTKPIDRKELEEAVRNAILLISERKTLHAYHYNSEFTNRSRERWQDLCTQGSLPEGGRMFAIEFDKELSAVELRDLTNAAQKGLKCFLSHPGMQSVYIGIRERVRNEKDEDIRAFVLHMLNGVETKGNAVISAPLELSKDAEYYAEHLLIVLQSIRGHIRGEILFEPSFAADRNRVPIPYGDAERLIRSIGELNEENAARYLQTLRSFMLSAMNFEHAVLLQFLISGMDVQLREIESGVEQIFADNIRILNPAGNDLPREKEYLILEDGVQNCIAELRTARSGQSRKAIRSVRKYIDEHYSEDLSLTLLSARFYIDPAQLSRDFKKNEGINLNRYIRQTRLHHAAVLLSNTDMKTAEVSARVGYEDPDYFMKLFREEYNMTPTAYRNMLK